MSLSDSGRLYASMFFQLPSKESYPLYYQVIQRPISLQDIKVRMLYIMI
jgi:hypothetical protein